MHVLSAVGARPQFVKLKPVHEALTEADARHTVVHTGQHYDAAMSKVFFEGLDLPDPDINLEVGSGTHATQTARILKAIEPVILDAAPDWVCVYGDTNSTLAGTLAATKQHIRVAHVEAGLRSFNRAMPEEINRVLTDHAADLLLAPTNTAMAHLATEGLAARSVQVGDVMADLVESLRPRLYADPPPAPYVVATLHRPANTDDPARLAGIIKRLARLPLPVRLLAHPRLRAAAATAGIDLAQGSIDVGDPQPYLPMMRLVANARGVVTDSGGLQKEAYLLGVPCTTVRTETEWPETLTHGHNVLDPDAEHLDTLVTREVSASTERPYGDGHAARRIVEVLVAGQSSS